MPVSANSRINYMSKRQKLVKGLKFGDRQNLINEAVRTGVYEGPTTTCLNNIPYHNVPSNAIQHDLLVEDDEQSAGNDEEGSVLSDEYADGVIDEISEADIEQNSSDPGTDSNSNNINNIAVEDRHNEIPPEPIAEDMSDGSDKEERHYVTRSGWVSKPHNFKIHFPGAAHVQVEGSSGRWLKPFYYDEEDMVDKLASGVFYSESYFSELHIEERGGTEGDAPIERWNDADQY